MVLNIPSICWEDGCLLEEVTLATVASKATKQQALMGLQLNIIRLLFHPKVCNESLKRGFLPTALSSGNNLFNAQKSFFWSRLNVTDEILAKKLANRPEHVLPTRIKQVISNIYRRFDIKCTSY